MEFEFHAAWPYRGQYRSTDYRGTLSTSLGPQSLMLLGIKGQSELAGMTETLSLLCLELIFHLFVCLSSSTF